MLKGRQENKSIKIPCGQNTMGEFRPGGLKSAYLHKASEKN